MVIWWRLPMQAGSFEEERANPEVHWYPDLDIYESGDQYLLVYDLPGVGLNDLDVSLAGRTVSVTGVRRVALPAGTVAHLVESCRGYFERRVRLPATADLAQVRTELRDGQLLVLVGKRPSAVVDVRIEVSQR
jgi:HSP20 family protein